MNTIPSVRSIRDALIEEAGQAISDPVALENLRANVAACARGIRRAIDRARDFSQRGLISEAAGLVEDFPDLARQAEALMELPSSNPSVARLWSEQIDLQSSLVSLPTREEVDALAGYGTRALEHRVMLDGLRIASLRAEPITVRLRLLRKIRAADSRNRMWLDQIERVEQEWLKRIGQLRHKDNPSRVELDEALAALEANEWVATVPRGLKEEIYAKVKPLRAGEAIGRYAELAAQIHDAASRMDRDELLNLEGAWALVNQETGRMPDEALAADIASAFDWLTRLQDEENAQAEFNGKVELLERMLLECRPDVEVERQIASLRDGGFSAPEGLVERAQSYILSARQRVQRRHRLVLVACVLGASVITLAAFLAIRAHSEKLRIEGELASLTAAISAKDSTKAHALAEQLRASGDEHDAQMLTALDAEQHMFDARNARTAAIKVAVAAAILELEAGANRTRVTALEADLIALRVDALEPERASVDQAEQLRIKRRDSLDEINQAQVSAALAAVDVALDAWKLPDEWSNEAQLDSQRWNFYSLELLRIQGLLKKARDGIEGYEAGLPRLKLKSDGVDSRLAEATSRQAALAAALTELDPQRLCLGVTEEEDFIKRLDQCLAAHGGTLARQGRLADFEEVKALGAAWIALHAWREDLRPQLAARLGLDFSKLVPIEEATAVLALIREFNRDHPSSPYSARLEQLANRFEANANSEVWEPKRIGLELEDQHFKNLEIVPCVGDKRFYRRGSTKINPPDNESNPLHRAVVTLADVSIEPDLLKSILVVTSRDVTGKPTLSVISKAWGQAQADLEAAQPHDASVLMLDLLSKIANANSEEPLFQLRALQRATSAFMQSGTVPAHVKPPLTTWLKLVQDKARDAIDADWVKAGWDDPVNYKVAVRQAKNALEQFPDLKRAALEAADLQATAAKALMALAPVGVLVPAKAGVSGREIFGSKLTEQLVVVVRRGSGWAFVDVRAVNGVCDASIDGLPKGPLLIFRSINK